MNLGLSEEQRLLRDSVERLVADTSSIEERRRIAASTADESAASWKRYAELGWLALPIAETHGGLVLLAPVTHPWPGGIAWYYTLTSTPLIGPLFAFTIAPPIGLVVLPKAVEGVFAPKPAPPDYAEKTKAYLVLRPSEFIANAQDVSALLDFVKQQSPRYGELKMPVAIFSGDSDDVVSVNIHSRAFAKQVPQTQLTVPPGVGHMPHYAEPEMIAAAIDRMARGN